MLGWEILGSPYTPEASRRFVVLKNPADAPKQNKLGGTSWVGGIPPQQQ